MADAVTPPKVERKEAGALCTAEVKALLSAAREDKLGALYVLAVHTGLRQGELLGSRWNDVGLETGKLTVMR